MPRLVTNQTNFTAGELTPRMKGRTDVARYQNGADLIENGIVLVHGGVLRRDGTRYLAATKYSSRVSRIIRYVLNVDQSYALEFGHRHIRVFDGISGAVILNPGLTPLEIVSPYSDEQLADITTKQRGDIMFLFHPNVRPYQLRRLSPVQWVLSPVPFAVEPFAELGHYAQAVLTLSASTVGTGRTFTTTPATVPNAPTIGTAYALDAKAVVFFTPPAVTGGLPITSYIVTSSPGGVTETGVGSPITIDGLTNGVSYTFTVKAVNSLGQSAASAASVSVTPQAGLALLNLTSTPASFSKVVRDGAVIDIAGPVVSASGGTSPYQFAWTKLNGTAAIIITRANTAQPLVKSTNFGATNYATLRCTVTDNAGLVGVIDVPFAIQHRQAREGNNEPPPGGDIP